MTVHFDVPSTWYKGFFTAPVNHFWERMVPDSQTTADVDFILRHLQLTQAARIADLACGAGRHSLALARLGHRVTGIDISADAIERAGIAAAQAGLSAEFMLGDLRCAALPEALDAILWLGNSLAYFAPEELPGLMGRLTESLGSGGHLLIETFCCAESLFPLQEEREMTFDRGTYRSTLIYDALRSLLKTKAELRFGGESHELLYAHYVITSGELVRLVASAGLCTLALFGGTDDSPFQPGCQRLLILARRE